MSKISKEERESIERRTLGQDKNPLWYEERTKRLSSSMFGKICKGMESDKTDKHKFARSLLEVTKIKAPSLDHRRKYEDLAISAYMSITDHDVKQEAHGPRFAHLSDLATADMQMLCNIFPILSSQLMKISSFEQFLVLKKNIWA